MRLIVLVALGGAFGSVLRYGVNAAGLAWLGPGFPWWTLAVNVVGSLVMGIVAAALLLRGGSDELRALIGTGVLGGFTTFSAFSLDFSQLIERGEPATALAYAGASVALSLAGVGSMTPLGTDAVAVLTSGPTADDEIAAGTVKVAVPPGRRSMTTDRSPAPDAGQADPGEGTQDQVPNVRPGGAVSIRVAPTTGLGPAFVTTIV